MLDCVRQFQHLPSLQRLLLFLDVQDQHAFEDMDRGCAIGVMLFHPFDALHRDEEHTQVVGFHEEFRKEA